MHICLFYFPLNVISCLASRAKTRRVNVFNLIAAQWGPVNLLTTYDSLEEYLIRCVYDKQIAFVW